MEIKYSWRFCLAFMAFVFVFGQLHEMAHLTVAYLVCGCPGKQVDFNLWTFGADCVNNPNTYIATMTGPVFSYLLMWAGYFLLRSTNSRWRNTGLVLVMGNLPFARIFTAAMGGGDETTVLKQLIHNQPLLVIKAIGFVLVFMLAFPPLFMVFKRLLNRYKVWHLVGLCLMPMIIMMLYEFKLLGKVLQAGFLSDMHFLGVADFIYIHTFIMVLIVLYYRKTLFLGGTE